MPLVIGILTQFSFLFGYAKPVPVTWNHLRHPQRDMVLVAAAGPMANIAMSLIWAGLFKTATLMHPESSNTALFLLLSAKEGIAINLILAFLNLIPIPPLDGSKVLMGLLPTRQAIKYAALEPYGFLILLALLFTNVLQMILSPCINVSMAIISYIFQL
jgi:Zn-dependent protease